MSTSISDTHPGTSSVEEQPTRSRRRVRRSSQVVSVLAHGEPFIWLTGGALVISIVMILGLLGLIATLGLGTFKPRPVIQVRLRDGRSMMGEVSKAERVKLSADQWIGESPETQAYLLETLSKQAGDLGRLTEMIQQRRDRLTTEAETAADRIEEARAEIEALNLSRSLPADAFERAAMIRNDSTALAVQEARAKLVAREQGLEGLKTEVESLENAIAYFDDPAHASIEGILNADATNQYVGVTALIDLAADESGEKAIEFRHRRLRTGNFELTNEHFNWVSDYQIPPQQESLPPEATLLERMKSGRFYGIPSALSKNYERAVTNGERELRTILDFIAEQRVHLSEDQAAELDASLPEVQAAYELARRNAVQVFLETVQADVVDGDTLRVFTESGETKSATEVTSEDVVNRAEIVALGAEDAWREFAEIHPEVRQLEVRSKRLEEHELGHYFAKQESARLAVRQAELDAGVDVLGEANSWLEAQRQVDRLTNLQKDGESIVAIASRQLGADTTIVQLLEVMRSADAEELQHEKQQHEAIQQTIEQNVVKMPKVAQEAFAEILAVEKDAVAAIERIQAEIDDLREESERFSLTMNTADGQEASMLASDIVRGFQPNQMEASSAWRVYFSRWWEFLSDEPRHANSEGGVLPAIWGTVVMTLIMSIAVVPFGVIAALYLREYAKSGPIVSVIRIAINNLAGVPSIVFGVFGLGFFCYSIGGFLDGGPTNARIQPMAPGRWYLVLGILAATSVGAFCAGVVGFSGRAASRGPVKRWLGIASTIAWLASFALLMTLIFKTPFFDGFFSARLPDPTWGKPGVLWAALTLALMTLPVVIVATEEALSAVPNSMREGSYGCGASKWQTIRRIVLPHAMPGIMTGMILAMARGAGEVAPLMLVGAVKLAPELPIDGQFPYLHMNRTFMHLGFHIFDVGFQSQNSEAAKPMVYTTTLLLITIIAALNLLAIWLRAFLKKRFASGQF